MNWDECVLCQTKKKEKLRGRPKQGAEANQDGAAADSGGSLAAISKIIADLHAKDMFSIELFSCENTEAAILARLVEKQAVYHSNCVSTSRRSLQRKNDESEKKNNESSVIPNKRSRRSEEQPMPLGESKCLFCLKDDDPNNLRAGGMKHASASNVNAENDESFSKKLRERAIKLNDTRILTFLSSGTAAARELNYHVTCLSGFYNRYRSLVQLEEKMDDLESSRKIQCELHFQKVVAYVIQERRNGTVVFAVNPLEKMYANFLSHDNIPYAPHVTHFAKRLKFGLEPSFQHNSGIEIRTIERSVKLCFSTDVDVMIEKETIPGYLCPVTFTSNCFN